MSTPISRPTSFTLRPVHRSDGLDYVPWIQTVGEYADQLLGIPSNAPAFDDVNLRPSLERLDPQDQLILMVCHNYLTVGSITDHPIDSPVVRCLILHQFTVRPTAITLYQGFI